MSATLNTMAIYALINVNLNMRRMKKNDKKHKPPELNSTVWPEPTRMRTTVFTQATAVQVTGATMDSCFQTMELSLGGLCFSPFYV